MMSAILEPFSLYIHWPFCKSKCPYCDFNSHVREKIQEDHWETALLAELAFIAEQMGRRSLGSMFFGGGTPSLMPPRIVEKLLAACGAYFTIAPDLEVTLEGNPTSIEADKYKAFKAAGVNRASIGIQSLRAETLQFLGREHSVSEAQRALEIAANTFERISFDLIYAVPGQTLQGWEQELQQALTLAKGHLSLYQLTIEPGTAFYHKYHRGDFVLPDEETAAQLYETTNAMLATQGYVAYEVSNYAQPGHQCRHNLGYWRYQDYACLGPGAHGRVTLKNAEQEWVKHELKNYRAPETWLAQVDTQGHGQEGCMLLTKQAQIEEHLLMNLRLFAGLDKAEFQHKHGIAVDRILDSETIASLVELGLLFTSPTHLQVTPAGMLTLNGILDKLITTLKAV
jgi:oxygen-independent coproporphyrinogen-3 oxidase